jgi:hypothetical protein
MYDTKSLMIPIKPSILIGLTFAIAIALPPIVNLMIAQAQHINLPQNTNDTKLIVSMKNHTLTYVNRTTNETIKVEDFPLYTANATTNETLTTGTANATTNETLTTGTANATTNETLTTGKANATTNENLTAKFKELQGK